MNPKIAQINRAALNDTQKIAELIEYVRMCDATCKEILDDAQALKKSYDNTAANAGEARAELLKYGIQIDNQFGGITI